MDHSRTNPVADRQLADACSVLSWTFENPGPDAEPVLGDPLKPALLAGFLPFEVADDRTTARGIVVVEAPDER